MLFKPSFTSSTINFATHPMNEGRLLFTTSGEICLDITDGRRVVYQEFVPAANVSAILSLTNKRANQLFVALDTNTLYRWDTSVSELVQVGGIEVDAIPLTGANSVEDLLKNIGFIDD